MICHFPITLEITAIHLVSERRNMIKLRRQSKLKPDNLYTKKKLNQL